MDNESLKIIDNHYRTLKEKHEAARKALGRGLTAAEKVLFSHLAPDFPLNRENLTRGRSFIYLMPDRVAMQDATAQMAVLQFMVTGRDTVSVPTTIHCDHLIRAYRGAKADLLQAIDENDEVYAFLKAASRRYGMGFWEPGAGIIHQVVLEQYAFPGGLMIGTDSHTPNAGGLGMIAIGVGGADAVDVMAGEPWGVVSPRLIGVNLKGTLSGWSAPKDVILAVAEKLTVKGGTGCIVEYFGDGTGEISATGKATITNMGAELGATTSVFPYDSRMSDYLRITGREQAADLADAAGEFLRADLEVWQNPEQYFDEIIEIDLSSLEPAWVGPHTPDLRHAVSAMGDDVSREGYPDNITAALIGSCTNSSYEDITRAASVVREAAGRGLKPKASLMVTPGSEQIYKTIERDGLLKIFTDAGAVVLANACGPCIGQWQRDDVKKGERNSIVTSYNRNFAKRNDGNPETCAFIGSPELVAAAAFYGRLSFDPRVDRLQDNKGEEFLFSEPEGREFPEKGFVPGRTGLVMPESDPAKRKGVKIIFNPGSERLEELKPFEPWDGSDYHDLPVLLKAKGKCTTDHISQAGPWLKYRGHLSNISNNCYLGAVNAFTGETGKGVNILTGQEGLPFPEIAKDYKAKGRGWVAVGDENYGEGSSREHAAMSPRFLGCRAVIARSFARIAETNLKRQGILPLTFCDPAAYDQIGERDLLDITGLKDLAPGSKLSLVIKKEGGEKIKTELKHTLTERQIEWFRAGSALNALGG